MRLVFTDEELALLASLWLDWEDRPLAMRRCDHVLHDLLRRGTSVEAVVKFSSLLEMREKNEADEEVRRFEEIVTLGRAVRELHGTGARLR